MRIIGCDLHARQQTLAILDTATGEAVNVTLTHEGNNVREFYSTLPGPVRVGIEATGSMKWFLHLMEELGINCEVGHPATIRAAEPRRQKHDQRDAELLLKLLVENRFPSIWQPSQELLDLRGLLLHRHQWVEVQWPLIPSEMDSPELSIGKGRWCMLPVRHHSVCKQGL